MLPDFLSEKQINSFIRNALAEDVGDGDHSTLGSVPDKVKNKARLLIKDNGIIAGVELAERIFHAVDPELTLSLEKCDGDTIEEGDIAFVVSGKARSILTAERLVLNCMQRMSGIATYARKLTDLIKGTDTEVMDTRKTTPNFRLMEKWAVSIGGGRNHRIGLYDMVMLKDNHIDFAGGIRKAIESTRKYLDEAGKDLAIEIETRNLEEVQEVVETGGVDVIMLDNMMPSVIREAIALIDGRYKTEASGGIDEETIREIAECGVDYISVGAITHSARSLDMSLKAV